MGQESELRWQVERLGKDGEWKEKRKGIGLASERTAVHAGGLQG